MSKADFPFTVPEASEGPSDIRRNTVFDILVSAQASKPAGTDVYKVSTSKNPDGEAEAEIAATDFDKAGAQAAYATLWIRAAAVEIGLGFHPDTPSAHYAPPLPTALAAQYDRMIGFCHDHLENPYEVAWGGWEDAGLVEASPKP